jgi:enamine deaminase RidA (YjgF/YER057c/UK114 family)
MMGLSTVSEPGEAVENLRAVCRAADGDFADVVRVTVYHGSRGFAKVNV